MKKNETMKSSKKVKNSTKIFRVIIIFWMFILFCYICEDAFRTIEINKKKEQFEMECLPHYVHKRQVQRELKKIDNDFQKERQPKCTIQIVFTELSSKVYELCYPPLKEKELTGVLALSLNQIPGEYDCMSKKEFRTLVNLGWSTCVLYDGSLKFETWWEALKGKLKENNIELPKTICFTNDSYNREMDVMLAKKGFQIVIQKKSKEIRLQEVNEGGIWHIEGQGWKGHEPRRVFLDAIEKHAAFALFVGFTEEDELFNEGSYRDLVFDLHEYSLTNQLIVGSSQHAREHFQKRVIEATLIEKRQYIEKKRLLRNKILEIEQTVNNIVEEYYYNGGSNEPSSGKIFGSNSNSTTKE